MIRNYIKIAFRTILKNKSYTILNVAGLSIGLVSAFLIFALVHYHYNFEKHNSKIDNIFRITSQFFGSDGEGNTQGVPYPFGKAFSVDFPQIPQVCMTEELYDPLVLIEEKGKIKKIKEENDAKAAFAQPNFFKIFDYKWLEGGPSDLKNLNMAVISKSQAIKYFGNESCIGKTFKLEGRLPLKIVGVFEDNKDNTDFPFLFIASYESLKEFYGLNSITILAIQIAHRNALFCLMKSSQKLIGKSKWQIL